MNMIRQRLLLWVYCVVVLLPSIVSSFTIIPSTQSLQSRTTALRVVADDTHDDQNNNNSNNNNNNNNNKNTYDVRVVLVDHYDSYTFNLYDMLANLCTHPPIVVSKDYAYDNSNNSNNNNSNNNSAADGSTTTSSTSELQLLPFDYDAIVLSPGPGRPSSPKDMGMTLNLIRNSSPDMPILGVCLGHQALAHVHGGIVTECQTPIHGQVHEIQLLKDDNTNVLWNGNGNGNGNGNVLWNGIDGTKLNVTRYHSLAVSVLPENCIPTALLLPCSSDENDDTPIIMGLQHKTLPQYGVQFHPESIGTSEGYTIIENFLKVCQLRTTTTTTAAAATSRDDHDDEKEQQQQVDDVDSIKPKLSESSLLPTTTTTTYHVSTRKLTDISAVSTTQVFERLYATDSHAIWLDSSNNQNNGAAAAFAQYSIMASPINSPLGKRIEYYGKEHSSNKQQKQGVHVTDVHGQTIKADDEDILDYLKRQQEESILIYDDNEKEATADLLPFVGGHLGYLGYELRHDTMRKLDELELSTPDNDDDEETTISTTTNPNVPTAAFLFCDQSIIYDHWNDEWHLVELTTPSTTTAKSDWLSATEKVLQSLSSLKPPPLRQKDESQHQHHEKLYFAPNRSRSAYSADIADCHDQIRRGESYELCLTNQLETSAPINTKDPWQLYKILRHRNPAPFAAYFNFQGKNDADEAKVSICCSSPERFVSVQQQQDDDNDDNQLFIVEAKPIKGTAARITTNAADDDRVARELQASIKNRAENLMIVDLLRNDLNRVCQTGTVHVPKLMAIESYATVHQMVSTIRGILGKDKTAIDVLTACFPGGSMTGAPKRRTMEILHDMEEGVSRGPYSGCLGYLSLNGRMDMNIVIRSAVLTPDNNNWKVSIGAGGAITALSESDDEYDEMLLKARAVKESVEIWASLTNNNNQNEVVVVVEEQQEHQVVTENV